MARDVIAVHSTRARWLGALVAVPLATGGPNSACEADTPPPGASAEERSDGQRGQQSGDRNEDHDAKGDGKGHKGHKGDQEKARDNTADEDGRSSGEVVCVVSADAPAFDSDNPRLIVGSANYWCESPGVDQLTVVVRVQRRHDDGTWITVASSRATARGRQTIRIDSRDAPAGWAQTSCRAGTYRTVVVAKHMADGDVRVVVDNSFQTTDPCADY